MSEIFKRKRPAWVGFLIAPLAPYLVLAIWGILNAGNLGEIIGTAALILPTSYLSSLIIGAPVVFALRRGQMNKAWHYTLAGLLAAAIPIFVVLVFPFMNSDPSSPAEGFISPHRKIAAMMTVSGALVAAAFWIVTRPDKTVAAE